MSRMEGDAEKALRSSVMSDVWKPSYDLKDQHIKQNIMEPPPSYQSL